LELRIMTLTDETIAFLSAAAFENKVNEVLDMIKGMTLPDAEAATAILNSDSLGINRELVDAARSAVEVRKLAQNNIQNDPKPTKGDNETKSQYSARVKTWTAEQNKLRGAGNANNNNNNNVNNQGLGNAGPAGKVNKETEEINTDYMREPLQSEDVVNKWMLQLPVVMHGMTKVWIEQTKEKENPYPLAVIQKILSKPDNLTDSVKANLIICLAILGSRVSPDRAVSSKFTDLFVAHSEERDLTSLGAQVTSKGKFLMLSPEQQVGLLTGAEKATKFHQLKADGRWDFSAIAASNQPIMILTNDASGEDIPAEYFTQSTNYLKVGSRVPVRNAETGKISVTSITRAIKEDENYKTLNFVVNYKKGIQVDMDAILLALSEDMASHIKSGEFNIGSCITLSQAIVFHTALTTATKLSKGKDEEKKNASSMRQFCVDWNRATKGACADFALIQFWLTSKMKPKWGNEAGRALRSKRFANTYSGYLPAWMYPMPTINNYTVYLKTHSAAISRMNWTVAKISVWETTNGLTNSTLDQAIATKDYSRKKKKVNKKKPVERIQIVIPTTD
jgi:hypothetical protein